MSLSNEDRRWFEDKVTMFLTDGWKDYIEQAKVDRAAAVNRLAYGNTGTEETWLIRGQINIMDRLINLEEEVTNAYDAAEAEDEVEDEDPND